MNIFDRIINFFKEVKQELKKVTWPSKKDTYRYTIAVIGVSLAVAFFLGAFDYLFTFLINKFLI